MRAVSAHRPLSFVAASIVALTTLSAAAAPGLNDCVDPKEPNCTTAKLDGIDLSGRSLPDANFEAAFLKEAKFVGADLTGANFQVVVAEGVDFSGAKLAFSPMFASFFKNAKFVGADLSGANLSRAILEGADFTGAKLDRAILLGARLGGAKWTDGRVCKPESVSACDAVPQMK